MASLLSNSKGEGLSMLCELKWIPRSCTHGHRVRATSRGKGCLYGGPKTAGRGRELHRYLFVSPEYLPPQPQPSWLPPSTAGQASRARWRGRPDCPGSKALKGGAKDSRGPDPPSPWRPSHTLHPFRRTWKTRWKAIAKRLGFTFQLRNARNIYPI